ncbi:MAG: TorD/DmsD family molecular chaperone [Bacillota bacterium]
MALAQPEVRRSRVYATLSRGFLYPADELLAEMRGGQFARSLRTGLPVDGAVRAERVQAALDAPGSREAEYNLLFAGQGVPCPLYETEYTSSHVWMQTQQMADIAGFYRAFGVDVQQSGERPDNLASQLEFMSLLCMKEAVATADGNAEAAEICREAQSKFLTNHLGRWLPKLTERMEKVGAEGFYLELVRLTDWFVQYEKSSRVTAAGRE